MKTNKILVATQNRNKFREIVKLNTIDKLEFLYKKNLIDIVEDGNNFFENAYKKAYETAKYYRMVSMADDSGLVVDALNGAPGIYSARYAGKEKNDKKNNTKLLRKLKNKLNRKARFKAIIVLARPDGKYWKAEGVCEGYITTEPKGENGFGYDPIFKIDRFNKTMAQLSLEEKNLISHRGKSIRKMLDKIDQNFTEIFKGGINE
ncbi:MAG: RdgB/HAM1 family non-canonical purine NTP pyrophosphatase [Candidatus Mcinerneyibacterium aminivorans]|jgi:XTP/dITP diphosphohydrolase|uniref:dITP/XTP pyrophosphatase n=1 Tax=Candidatus Mcinerneyibacterium aminivorans TaxID=2703815 RepID=A0A5D0MDB9_9BACT|nr:MAG: RdgB/HAM1 family non-canonical purine NTP pyrophosphatase [Candidatus Mcinerneyibacterium aminivorans]